MNDTACARYSIARDVVFCDLRDNIVLLDTLRSSYFSLNPVAAECWSLLERQCTLEELCTRISSDYGVPVEACRDDIRNLLDDLLQAGLIEATSDAAA